MYAKVAWHEDMWQEIKDSAMFTVHKWSGKYPDSGWKRRILLAEHSPIRIGKVIIEIHEVPSYVIGHLVRHNIGFTPFVPSLRSDRYDSGGVVPDRNTLNAVRFEGNFQAFINISRRRLCRQASEETRKAWQLVKDAISKVEPELASCMVPECVYRGFCPEMRGCGFAGTDRYCDMVLEYRGIGDE